VDYSNTRIILSLVLLATKYCSDCLYRQPDAFGVNDILKLLLWWTWLLKCSQRTKRIQGQTLSGALEKVWFLQKIARSQQSAHKIAKKNKVFLTKNKIWPKNSPPEALSIYPSPCWMKCVSVARSKRGLCVTKQFEHIRRRRECRREKQAAELAQGKVTQAPRYHTDARKVSAALVLLGRRSCTA
jgi:hypothetical protein